MPATLGHSGPPPDSGDLFTELYEELRGIARRQLANERGDHTLQATALVHEAYVRLSAPGDERFVDRHHFLAVAAKVMRQILVDHAKGRNRLKRGGALDRTTLAEVDHALQTPDPVDVLDVDDALLELEKLDARQAHIVELRFFAGMTGQEIASLLALSPETVRRDWTMARAWLSRRLRTGGAA